MIKTAAILLKVFLVVWEGVQVEVAGLDEAVDSFLSLVEKNFKFFLFGDLLDLGRTVIL